MTQKSLNAPGWGLSKHGHNCRRAGVLTEKTRVNGVTSPLVPAREQLPSALEAEVLKGGELEVLHGHLHFRKTWELKGGEQ